MGKIKDIIEEAHVKLSRADVEHMQGLFKARNKSFAASRELDAKFQELVDRFGPKAEEKAPAPPPGLPEGSPTEGSEGEDAPEPEIIMPTKDFSQFATKLVAATAQEVRTTTSGEEAGE